MSSCKTYYDVYFDPNKCLIHSDSSSHILDIQLIYKDVVVLKAVPRNKTVQDFQVCTHDTLNFSIEKLQNKKNIIIPDFTIDSDFAIAVTVERKETPKNREVHYYYFEMSSIKDCIKLMYTHGSWAS